MKFNLPKHGLAGPRWAAMAVLLAAAFAVVAPSGAQADQPANSATVAAADRAAKAASGAAADKVAADRTQADKSNQAAAASNANSATNRYLAGIDPALLQRRETLMAFKSWLIGVPGISEAGFVESANYPETLSTTLLWSGRSSLQDAVRGEAARRGITVTFKSVKYSRKQVQEATDRVWASVHSPVWKDFVVTSVVGPDLTHDGIVVRGHHQAKGADTAAAQAQTLASAQSVANAVDDVAIAPDPTLYATRSTDFSPYNAGGMIRGSDGSGCTSGFAIWRSGYSWTTTARHCTAASWTAWDAPGNSYGNAYDTSASGGRMLTGDGYQLMFDGAWNDPNGFAKTVVGFADLSINDWVCSSGANSGVHCGIQVDNLSVSFNDGFGSFSTIRGQQRDPSQIGGAHGDSGGPMLVPYSTNNWTTVGAAGMLQGSLGPQTSSCGSLRIATTCASEIEFSSMRTVVNDLGATLRTG
ncbi:hypothetical protein F0L68_37765 [Solihabitans fulvus]|uniref:Streptogrisin C n=1 Tax=Solihabitans fulvus TaxID=1892852 RepID=A0A5B2WMA7_9PSEU|nr:hypothetical protein [Solihabitans fulvus]KAA2251177.1 hypothetical protein F0L68_37765 [Solihabitans fulvus]